jgi:hypothetical protein
MTCWRRFQRSRLMPLAVSAGQLGHGGQGTHSQPLTFSETCPAGRGEACREVCYGVLGSPLSNVGFYPTCSLTIVEHPTESRDIHKYWHPPPHGMGLGVAVMNAIGSINLGAAQIGRRRPTIIEFAAFTMLRRLLDSRMGREADAHRFHVEESICGARAHRGNVGNAVMASCEALPLGERSKHGGQIAQSVATCGPLDPENDRRKAKLIAVLSCLTSAADLVRAGSMHNKSATLVLADALEACWEIKKGSEAIRPAA